MPDIINKKLLIAKIMHSGDFTTLEKRYLEERVEEPPREHGEWELTASYEPPYNWFVCSVCRYTKQIYSIDNPKFCENCGAKMKNGWR